MTANWKVMRNTLIWLLVAVMTLGVVIASPYTIKSTAAAAKVTVAKADNGKWGAVKNGKIDTSVTGIYKNKYGWWRVEKGYVNFKANGIYKNEYGWWKTTNGKVTFKETGVFQNSYGWWRVENSKVNFKANSIYQNKYGWWKTTNGKVTFKENGVFSNQYGSWKVEKSKVNFNYNGRYTYNKVDYIVDGGRAYKATNEFAVQVAEETISDYPLSRAMLIAALTDTDVGFTKAEATYGVDHAKDPYSDETPINWNQQALLVAADYLFDDDWNPLGISRDMLEGVLTDGYSFKDSEVAYAMKEVDKEAKADANFWNDQAVVCAKELIKEAKSNGEKLTKAELKELLTDYELFTEDQADYGVANSGL